MLRLVCEVSWDEQEREREGEVIANADKKEKNESMLFVRIKFEMK